MAAVQVMILPLRELESAIDAGDVPMIMRKVARLVELVGPVYAEPRKLDARGNRLTPVGYGDRVVELERCAGKLDAMSPQSGLGGVVWDQGWVVATLQYLAALLRGAPVEVTPTA